jgi:hypothetical protein
MPGSLLVFIGSTGYAAGFLVPKSARVVENSTVVWPDLIQDFIKLFIIKSFADDRFGTCVALIFV